MGTFLILLLAGCTGISSVSRLDLFDDMERSYRLALRDSDFKAAANLLDPEGKAGPIDYDKYNAIKVVRYKTTKIEPSDDKLEIRQEVEIQYYRQSHPVVKIVQDDQLWRYRPLKKMWLLQTGLPVFD